MQPQTKIQSLTRRLGQSIEDLLYVKYLDRTERFRTSKECLKTSLDYIINNNLSVEEIKEMRNEIDKI